MGGACSTHGRDEINHDIRYYVSSAVETGSLNKLSINKSVRIAPPNK